MKRLVNIIKESNEEYKINDMVNFIKNKLTSIEDKEKLSNVYKKIKSLLIKIKPNGEDNIDSFIDSILDQKQEKNIIDKISETIVNQFDKEEDVDKFCEFIKELSFNPGDDGNVIDFNEIIDKSYKGDDESPFINKTKQLFIDIANINIARIGKYEFALRIFFNNIDSAEKEDLTITNGDKKQPFEVKSDIWAIKSAGAKSAKECEIAFIENLDLPQKFESKLISKKKNKNYGIFYSTQKIIEFNEFLSGLENPVSYDKLVESTIALIDKRCGNTKGLDEILKNVIIESDKNPGKYIFKTRPQSKNGNVNHSDIKGEDYIEKVLFCADFFNLTRDDHKNMLIFEGAKSISRGNRSLTSKCVYYNFDKVTTFKQMWDKLSINNDKDVYFKIDSLWGYQSDENAPEIEQSLVCGTKIIIK